MTPEAPTPDTIAAIATARGRGAVAMVRVSGPGAGMLLLRVAPGLRGALPPPRTVRLTSIHDPETGASVDRAVVSWLPAPGSYTGEDTVELSVHGGVLIPDLVLAACLRAGARQAQAGEFTQRAYLNGKVDLVQAEAVDDLIAAQTEAQRRAALVQSEGGLSERLHALREGLIRLEALLMYHVDFPEEDEPPVPVERIVDEADGVLDGVARLLGTAPEGELLREGALAVLAGRPNSGKSSLLNALLGESRVIVTEEPGTTRDAVEVGIAIHGFPFRLVDTAGIREGAGKVEQLGIEVARRYLARADVVLLCLDAGEDWGEGERAFGQELPEGTPVIHVRTKSDLVDSGRVDSGLPDSELVDSELLEGSVLVSSVSGEGLDQLRDRMRMAAFGGLVREGLEAPVITRRRQRIGLERAGHEVAAFVSALRDGVPAEVAATHLRAAESALEELLGVIAGEEVLDRVFRDFCIGK